MRICKECKIKKDSSDFYGVQGECKECTKKRVRLRNENLKKNPEWVEKERLRGRDKYHRLYSNSDKKLDENKKVIWMTPEEIKLSNKKSKDAYKEKYPEKEKTRNTKYRKKYPEKYACIIVSQRLKPLIKGNQLHHWNYNIEFAKDVIELDPKDHAKIHRFIRYDKKTFMYKDLNGNLLDTREKHEELIKKVLDNF